jgi:hypothetical protein
MDIIITEITCEYCDEFGFDDEYAEECTMDGVVKLITKCSSCDQKTCFTLVCVEKEPR